jgi:hypothetical protein
MTVIGVDAHKSSHALAALSADSGLLAADSGQLAGEHEIAASEEGRPGGVSWAEGLGHERVRAIEDCRHVSRRLEQALEAYRSLLLSECGVGALTAATLIGRTAGAERFSSDPSTRAYFRAQASRGQEHQRGAPLSEAPPRPARLPRSLSASCPRRPRDTDSAERRNFRAPLDIGGIDAGVRAPFQCRTACRAARSTGR